jgi:hypothetical protein
MQKFFHGLLRDLDRSCRVLEERLAAPDLPEEVNANAVRAYVLVQAVHREVRARLGDPDIIEPTLLPSHLRLYRRWGERVRLVEGSILPAIERYSSRDRLATRLCARLAQQVNWPISAPLVVTLSANYYWSLASVNLICIPAAEDASLLGLPDLCHEMAHLLLEVHPNELLGDFPSQFATYISQQRQRIAAGELPAEHGARLDILEAMWTRSWLREFVPDIVAAFLVGPPYGWQHLRVSSRSSGNPYSPSFGEASSHPADDARLTCILAVLRALGMSSEANELEAVWVGYAAATLRSRPAYYELAYPTELLGLLVKRVVARDIVNSCGSAG